MKCPDCHIELNENFCLQCGKRFNESQMNTQQNKNNDVLEPELVNDNDDWNRQHVYKNNEQTRNSFRKYTFINPNYNINASCLPSFISLFLTLAVWIQLGFLAALGFVFFLLIGKAISLAVMLKGFSRGRIIHPLLLNSVVWVVSYSLAAWLAS